MYRLDILLFARICVSNITTVLKIVKFEVGRVLSPCLTDQRRPSAPPESLPLLRHTPRVGEVFNSR
jgi:hypothetical protein